MLLSQVHSNNRHTQGVRVFSKVECLFKPGLLQPWSSPALSLPVPLEDLKDPSSRPISLPLGGRPAQILRCKFYFADRWLLISEISFLSGRKTNSSSFVSRISDNWLIQSRYVPVQIRICTDITDTQASASYVFP